MVSAISTSSNVSYLDHIKGKDTQTTATPPATNNPPPANNNTNTTPQTGSLNLSSDLISLLQQSTQSNSPTETLLGSTDNSPLAGVYNTIEQNQTDAVVQDALKALQQKQNNANAQSAKATSNAISQAHAAANAYNKTLLNNAAAALEAVKAGKLPT